MTGAELCRQILTASGVRAGIVAGPANQYVPGERLIILRPHCYGGRSPAGLTLAAHEAGHALQHADWGWMLPCVRWLTPGQLWLEWDASRRARALMAGLGMQACEEVLLDSWRSYVVPAACQTALMLLLLGAGYLLRK